MILDLIANNNWERPVYFNNTSLMGVNLDFRRNVVQQGNAFRLLPVVNNDPSDELVDTKTMYDNMMNNFFYRELDNSGVYYNEDYRNFALNHRSSFNTLARSLINAGEKEQAREVLNVSLDTIPDAAIPYDYVTAQSVGLLFAVGEEERATEIAELLGQRADEMLTYLAKEEDADNLEQQKQLVMLNEVSNALKRAGNDELAQQYESVLNKYLQQPNN